MTGSGSPDNQTYLGRAWDEGVSGLSAYVNGTSPNGQVTIRDSTLGSHIRKTAPWNASTATRPFCSSNCTNSANRFLNTATVVLAVPTDPDRSVR